MGLGGVERFGGEEAYRSGNYFSKRQQNHQFNGTISNTTVLFRLELRLPTSKRLVHTALPKNIFNPGCRKTDQAKVVS